MPDALVALQTGVPLVNVARAGTRGQQSSGLGHNRDPIGMRGSGGVSWKTKRASDRLSPARGPLPVCAPEGIRTPNLLIRSQMLYPLSYGRMVFNCHTDVGQQWRRREDLNLRSALRRTTH